MYYDIKSVSDHVLSERDDKPRCIRKTVLSKARVAIKTYKSALIRVKQHIFVVSNYRKTVDKIGKLYAQNAYYASPTAGVRICLNKP